jgi:hypothetical protein
MIFRKKLVSAISIMMSLVLSLSFTSVNSVVAYAEEPLELMEDQFISEDEQEELQEELQISEEDEGLFDVDEEDQNEDYALDEYMEEEIEELEDGAEPELQSETDTEIESLEAVTHLNWVEGSSATLSWDASEGANYYSVEVYVYDYEDETLIGSTETGTSETELDVQQEIHKVIGTVDYDVVKVSASVTAQQKKDDVLVLQSIKENTVLYVYQLKKLIKLSAPTNVTLTNDLILKFEHNIENPKDSIRYAYVSVRINDIGYSGGCLYPEQWQSNTIENNIKNIIDSAYGDGKCTGKVNVAVCLYFVANKGYVNSDSVLSNTVEYDGNIKVNEFNITPASPIICLNRSYYLGKTILPLNAYYEHIEWSSDNSNIVTIDETGKITGISTGTANITAKIGNVSDTVTVNVYKITSNVENEDDKESITDTAGEIIDDIVNNDNPDIGNTDIDPEDLDDIKDEIQEAIENGDTFHTDIVAIQQYFDLYKKNWGQIQKAARELNAQFEGAYNIEVEMYHKDKNDNTHVIGNITELENEITFTFDLPTGMKEQQSGQTKKYVLVRIHKNASGEEEYEQVDYTLNGDGTFTAKSDKYSDFVWCSVLMDSEDTIDDVTGLNWVQDSSATLAWTAVPDANYYAIKVNVYDPEDDTLIGSKVTGTTSTELDVQQEIHDVIGENEYEVVEVRSVVYVQVMKDDVVIVKSEGVETSLWTYRLTSLVKLQAPTNLRLSEEYTLTFDHNVENWDESINRVIVYTCINNKNIYVNACYPVWEDGSVQISLDRYESFANYKGISAKTKNFNIIAAALTNDNVDITVRDLVYNTKKAKAGNYFLKDGTSIFVSLDGILLNSKEYSVKYYQNGTQLGKNSSLSFEGDEATIKVVVSPKSGNKNYSIGSEVEISELYKVRKIAGQINISSAKVTVVKKTNTAKTAKIGYTGNPITFDGDQIGNQDAYIKLVIGSGKNKITLIENGSDDSDQISDYFDITYVNNTRKGKAKIIITPKNSGEYVGTAVGTFTIGASSTK